MRDRRECAHQANVRALEAGEQRVWFGARGHGGGWGDAGGARGEVLELVGGGLYLHRTIFAGAIVFRRGQRGLQTAPGPVMAHIAQEHDRRWRDSDHIHGHPDSAHPHKHRKRDPKQHGSENRPSRVDKRSADLRGGERDVDARGDERGGAEEHEEEREDAGGGGEEGEDDVRGVAEEGERECAGEDEVRGV